MNIIKHLTEKVSSAIIKGNTNHGETALLEKFYSIVLARMTDKDAYNKLTNSGKLSAKKITFYKVFHNINWEGDNCSKKLIANLAENHDLKEETVKGMVKQATPLIFTELNVLAKDSSLPEYLQNLLTDVTDDEGFFAKFIPSWALELLPKKQVAVQIFQVAEKTSINKKNTDNKNTNEDNEHNEKNPKSIKQNDTQKELPNPVHADARNYSYEKIASPETDSSAGTKSIVENDDSGIKGLLPIIGLIIFASLAWALLRGCQESGVTDLIGNSKQPSVSVASEDGDVTVIKNNQSTNETTNKASFFDSKTGRIIGNASAVSLAVDKDGKLKNAKVLAGSNALGFKVNSAIAKVFGENALNSTKVSVDNKRNNDFPSMDKFNELFLLVQSVPNASMVVSGRNVRFDASTESSRKKLVEGAKNIVSNFSISSGALPTLSIVKDDNSNNSSKVKEKPAVSEMEKTTADDKKEKQSNESAEKKIAATDKNEQEKTESASKEDNKAKDAKKLDIDTEVTKSIDDSKKILADLTGTGNEPEIQAIEKALNTQIINFAVNNDQIPEANKVILNQVASILKDMDARLTIIGHTDSDGDAAYNKRLSQDRSFSVKKYLMSQGMSSRRMKADGVGESKPITSNSTPEGKFQNRRIEFKVTKIDSAGENAK